MLKRILTLAICFLMLCTTPVLPAAGEEPVKVTLNGELMSFDVEPVIENGRTLVPMRAIFEAFGCSVSFYDIGVGKVIVARRGDDMLKLIIGETTMELNERKIELDVPAKIFIDRTLVPLRAVSEALQAKVEWKGESRTACIEQPRGDHEVQAVVFNNQIKDETGALLIDIAVTYPVITKAGSAYAAEINKTVKGYAEAFIKEAQGQTEQARKKRQQAGELYVPQEYILTYTVDTDRAGLFSVTQHRYVYTGGVHPAMSKVSRVYNMNEQKQLAITDVMAGADEDAIEKEMSKSFVDLYAKEEFANRSWQLDFQKKGYQNMKFFLRDDAAVFYFDAGTVAPETYGFPMVTVPYTETDRFNLKNLFQAA